MGNKLIKLTNKPETDPLKEQYVYATIPPRPVETITQGRKTNRLVQGINNYFGELKYRLNNTEPIPGKYTLPAVFLAASTGPALVKTIVTNPTGFLKTLGLSFIGGKSVDAASKAITDKTWGENISDLTGLDTDIADYTNIGYFIGPKLFKSTKGLIKKLINRPQAWEILPDGTKVKLPTESVKYHQEIPSPKLPQERLFGSKSTKSSQFIPNEQTLYEFGERYKPSTYFEHRLKTGGWDKLGISNESYIMIPKNHRLATNEFTAKSLGIEPMFGNDDFVKVNTRKFILSMINRKPNSTTSGSYYNGGNQDVYIDSKDWTELIEPQIKDLLDTHPDLRQNLEDIVKAHELFHFTHLSGKLQGRYRNNVNNTNIISEIPSNKVSFHGVDYNLLDDEMRDYFTRSYGTEMMARFSQLRDFFGIYDSKQPLTIEQWNYAKKHYPFNNDMRQFFNCVTDPKKFLKHMNKIVPISVYGLLNINDDEEETD